jgi:hypothetical protein
VPLAAGTSPALANDAAAQTAMAAEAAGETNIRDVMGPPGDEAFWAGA